MKYEKPNVEILQLLFSESVITASGDYEEGVTDLEDGKEVDSPTIF